MSFEDRFFPVQETFRIIREGERAGLYHIELLPTDETRETLLGDPLMVKSFEEEPGGRSGLVVEWRDTDGRKHALTIPKKTIHARRFLPVLRQLSSGGWGCRIVTGKEIQLFGQFLIAAWNSESPESMSSVRDFWLLYARSAAPSMRESRGISLWQDGVA